MTLNGLRFKILPAPPPLSYSAQNLNQLEVDLVSNARKWAVDEIGAAMAHQLNDPLTALLLYLHEAKEREKHTTGMGAARNSVWEMVDRALQEAERLCDIMERMGRVSEAPVDAETAVARGRDAIDLWRRSSNAQGSGYGSFTSPRSGEHGLTPREREVLGLIVNGASNKEGGHQLGIKTRTFEVHRAHIMEKLGAKNAADLVRIALSGHR